VEYLHELTNWMLDWAASPWAPFALIIFAFWESSFFPVPPDPLLITMAVARPELGLVYAAIATAASVTGAVLGYIIGARGGRPIVQRLFSPDKILLAERLYQRYDVWAITVAAFTPIPFKVFTITAGVAQLDFRRFMLASVAGRGGRFFLVGGLVTIFGDSIEHWIDQYFEFVTIGFVVLLIGGFIAIHYVGQYLARRERVDAAIEPQATDR
jgi:membrane protein YqaA with SNARE-associated domain